MKNPKWQREELILTLNVYFNVGYNTNTLSKDIIDLSNVLRNLNVHNLNSLPASYRNPSSVGMKMSNFYAIENPGHGLSAYSKLDEEIFNEFKNNRQELKKLAKVITTVSKNKKRIVFISDDENFPEGKIVEKIHKSKERNQKLVQTKKQNVLNKEGILKCEVCGFAFEEKYGEIGKDYIECHHIIPLCEIEVEKQTKLDELVLVCANCHRILHRKRPWMKPEELKKIVDSYN